MQTNRSFRSITASLAVPMLALTACGGSDGPAAPNERTVTMGASSFSPATMTVQAGQSVTWRNSSGILHNVTFAAPGAPTDIGDHTSGSSARSFPAAGTFDYTCTNHAGMNGSVNVQ
jgi:plastocyanin